MLYKVHTLAELQEYNSCKIYKRDDCTCSWHKNCGISDEIRVPLTFQFKWSLVVNWGVYILKLHTEYSDFLSNLVRFQGHVLPTLDLKY